MKFFGWFDLILLTPVVLFLLYKLYKFIKKEGQEPTTEQ